jgi:hypothetical protein
MIQLDELKTKTENKLNQNVDIKLNGNKQLDISGLDYVGRESESGKSVIVAETRGAQYVTVTTSGGKQVVARLQMKLYVVK